MNKQLITLVLLINAFTASVTSFCTHEEDNATKLKNELLKYSGKSAEEAIDTYEEDIDFDADSERYLALAQHSNTYYNRRDIASKISTQLVANHITTTIPVSASRPTV